jgi:hypothetical protein
MNEAKPASGCTVEDHVRFLRWVDKEYGILDVFGGCGCEHGFKPARDCPNEACERAEMHRLYDKIMSESNADLTGRRK